MLITKYNKRKTSVNKKNYIYIYIYIYINRQNLISQIIIVLQTMALRFSEYSKHYICVGIHCIIKYGIMNLSLPINRPHALISPTPNQFNVKVISVRQHLIDFSI